MTKLIFEEPSPDPRHIKGQGPSPVANWLALLRKYPGEWVKYPERKNTNTVQLIKKGRGYGAAPGEFEAVSRNVGEKSRCDMYVRYMGEPETRE